MVGVGAVSGGPVTAAVGMLVAVAVVTKAPLAVSVTVIVLPCSAPVRT